MELIDPRLALIAGVGGAIVGSERVRNVIGRGMGYAAKGVVTVTAPVARPVLHAGEDIFDEARNTAKGDGRAKKRTPAKSAA